MAIAEPTMTSPAATFEGFDSFKLSGVIVTEHVLGCGSYATVLEVKYKGQRCAGKKIHEVLLAQGSSTYVLRRFEEECRLLTKVHHPNIIQFLSVYFQANCSVPVLVMEFLPINLSSCIERHGILSEEIMYSILHDVASGLHYLHSHDPVIIHRDLSSNNVLLTSDFHVAKISDLGMGRVLDRTPQQIGQLTGIPGTPAYMPPEVIGSNPQYDTSVDTFSFGIFMIHMLCGHIPVPQCGQIRMDSGKMIPVSEAERREVFLQVIESDIPLMDIIQRCINNSPQLRPPAGEILAYIKHILRHYPSVSNAHLTLNMPSNIALSKKAQDQKKRATYEIVTEETPTVPDGKGQRKKLAIKGTQSRVSRKPSFNDPAIKGTQSRVSRKPSFNDGKVRIPTSWAQKKFKKAARLFSPKDRSKLPSKKGTHEVKTFPTGYPIHVAKFDYESHTSNEMSLNRGEKLCITNTDDENWWYACSPDTGKEGYIPSNYLAELDNPVYTALYDYKSKEEDELGFSKGDKLHVIHTGNGEWWFVRSCDTRKEGFVPWNYLTQPTYPIYAAMYDYVSCSDSDLSFKQSDQLCIIDDGDRDWWFARSMETGEEGFVPSNHLTEVIYPIYAAMYDYQSRTDDDLSFEKSDLLCILSADDKDWWFARSKDTGREGYVPSNYVAKVNSLNIHKWYFGDLSRMEAERRFLEEVNGSGSFLVRQSQTIVGGYVLSVYDKVKVRHYKLHHKQKGAFNFFISDRLIFKTIAGLVSHYQTKADGLCIKLARPCISSLKPQTPGISKHTNDKWDIDRTQLKRVKNLGEGTFAVVLEGLWNGKIPVALKSLKIVTAPISRFIQEAALMRKLRHHKIVQVYAVSTEEEPLYIITEFMKHGSLLGYLHTTKGRSLKLPHLVNIATQVAEGMAYLEEQDYTHCDLCAKNVLVGDSLECKVVDCGLIRVIGSDLHKAHTGAEFRVKWTAPEVAADNKFTIKSDVWSFGILLYEIITYGRFPYPDLTNDEVIEKVTQGYRMPQPKECSYMYYNIMLKCWREEPENRPTFEALQWELEEFLESTR